MNNKVKRHMSFLASNYIIALQQGHRNIHTQSSIMFVEVQNTFKSLLESVKHNVIQASFVAIWTTQCDTP